MSEATCEMPDANPPDAEMMDILKTLRTVAIVEEAIRIGAKVIWMQLGLAPGVGSEGPRGRPQGCAVPLHKSRTCPAESQ